MVTLTWIGTRASAAPVLLSCISFLNVVSANDALESARAPDSQGGSPVEEIADFFRALVRGRRQLGKRSELDKMGFTEIERQALLAIHNGHRSTVNPSAANMIEVRWNTEIGDFAQNWSENCQYQHRSNRNLGEWTNMGENIFFTSGIRFSEKEAVDLWWNEYRDYTYETKECTPGKQCGHYVTAAWARTEFIGCGITRCDTLEGVGVTAYLIVCNYSGRFFSNTRPFEEGTSCSNCPSSYPRCRYNLCVTDDMLNNCDGYNGTTIYLSATRVNSASDPMNCPDFIVDPVVTTTESQTSEIPTVSGVTTDSSNRQNTTEADSGSCRAVFSSILILVLCLNSCFLIL